MQVSDRKDQLIVYTEFKATQDDIHRGGRTPISEGVVDVGRRDAEWIKFCSEVTSHLKDDDVEELQTTAKGKDDLPDRT